MKENKKELKELKKNRRKELKKEIERIEYELRHERDYDLGSGQVKIWWEFEADPTWGKGGFWFNGLAYGIQVFASRYDLVADFNQRGFPISFRPKELKGEERRLAIEFMESEQFRNFIVSMYDRYFIYDMKMKDELGDLRSKLYRGDY